VQGRSKKEEEIKQKMAKYEEEGELGEDGPLNREERRRREKLRK
jgi:hypothetical protein